MNKSLIAVLSAAVLLGGCVSQQSQNALAALQVQCNAGNGDACTAAGYQAQANQQELTNNSAVAAGIGAALLGMAVVAQPVFIDGQPVTYFSGGYMVGGRRYAGRPAVQNVGARRVAGGYAPQKKNVSVR
jgi:hypothetical protein